MEHNNGIVLSRNLPFGQALQFLLPAILDFPTGQSSHVDPSTELNLPATQS